MENIILIILVQVFTIIAFVIGAKINQMCSKNQDIEIIPEIKTPIQVYKEHKENKVQEEIDKTFDVMLENIENYDGTGRGQKDIPDIK